MTKKLITKGADPNLNSINAMTAKYSKKQKTVVNVNY